MLMQCEPKRGANTMAAFSHLWKEVQEKIQVPEGYKMTYFGEQSEQDKGNKAIAANIPLMFGLIYVTLLFLFPKYYRKPVLIMAMLPVDLHWCGMDCWCSVSPSTSLLCWVCWLDRYEYQECDRAGGRNRIAA